MKKSLFVLLMCGLFALLNAKELKILTIGNSFADSVLGPLNAIVRADPENQVIIERANIGGCTLLLHWQYHDQGKTPYDKKYSLVDKLKKKNWDIVTIQQASHHSWQADTFYPAADYLIKLIRQYAPKAEIIIQQTWSYRIDSPRFAKWKIDQNEMYKRLTGNYKDLAKKYNLRIIPTGYAVQLYRTQEKKPFKPFTKEQLAAYKRPAFPPADGDVVGRHYWHRNKNGEWQLAADQIHMNERGAYLQGCVWYFFIFGEHPVKYVPKNIKTEDAKALQKIALQAVKTFPQVKNAK